MWKLGISVSSHGGFFVVGSGGAPCGAMPITLEELLLEKLSTMHHFDFPRSQEGVLATGSVLRQFSSPKLKG